MTIERTIGEYDAEKRTVPVTFVHNGVTHTRDVNACHNEAGEYDAECTAERVDEVGLGVQNKIELGVITNVGSSEEESE